jgi:hypothetical protein
MQDKVYSLHSELQYVKTVHEEPNRTVPNWTARNQTVESQTKARIVKSSCLEKRTELNMTKVDWQSSFYGLRPLTDSLEKHDVQALFPSSGQEASDLMGPSDQDILSHQAPQRLCNLLRYATRKQI